MKRNRKDLTSTQEKGEKRPIQATMEDKEYRTAVENATDFIHVIDRKGKVLSVNKCAAALFGRTPKEIEGKSIFDIFPKEVATQFWEHLSEVFRTGKGELDHDSRMVVGGKEFWTSVRLDPITDSEGNISAVLGVTRDITERKRIEDELHATRDRLEFLVSSTPAVIYTCKAYGDHAITFVSPNVTTQLGYAAEEFTKDSKFWVNHLHPEDRQSVLDGLASLHKEGHHVQEYRIQDKDSSYKRIHDESKLIRDATGNPAEVVGCWVNVTNPDLIDGGRRKHGLSVWKRAEQLEDIVEGQATQLREFANLLPQVAFETDEASRLTFVNRNALTMTGYTQEDLDKGLSIFQMVTSRDRERAKEDMFRVLRAQRHSPSSERLPGQEYAMLTKDGRTFPVVIYADPIFRCGKAVGLRGIAVDITERKRMEENLLQSEEKYRELFEASPVSLWEEDFSTVKQYFDELERKGVSDLREHLSKHPEEVSKCIEMVRVLSVNEATLKLYDAKSKEEIIEEFRKVLSERSYRTFVQELVAWARGNTYFADEMETRTLSGETKHVNLICSVVPGYERTLAKILVCIVDLTLQKKLEEKLVKSERLAAIGETASMVAHDLRNPLQGIAGATYNIRNHLRTAPDPSTKEMLAVIDNGVEYANEIVNDLLEFSREIQLQLLPTTPKSIVKQALANVNVPDNVRIENTTTDSPPILADEPKLRRVLTNLIQNAIDAMPEGGTLSISSTNSTHEVSISVADSGVGIAEDQMKKIWTPLYTNKAKGIGLGLPICKRIVEAHGGSISVESSVEKGTTVTLKLPIEGAHGGEPS